MQEYAEPMAASWLIHFEGYDEITIPAILLSSCSDSSSSQPPTTKVPHDLVLVKQQLIDDTRICKCESKGSI